MALLPPPPSWLMEKVPSLLSFMTAGMEGKMRQASRVSRAGPTASTILSASSSMKMREPMKILAAAQGRAGRGEGQGQAEVVLLRL
jgi:hypothetical protein